MVYLSPFRRYGPQSFCYRRRQQQRQQTCTIDKGEAADGVALKIYRHYFFGFTPIRLTIENRTVKFLERYISSENIVCSCFARIAAFQLNGLLRATVIKPTF